MTKGKKSAAQFTVRPGEPLAAMIEDWSEQNPGISLNQLASMALRDFITKPRILLPVPDITEMDQNGGNDEHCADECATGRASDDVEESV